MRLAVSLVVRVALTVWLVFTVLGCALPTQPSRSVEPTVTVAPDVFVISSAEQLVVGAIEVDDDVAWEISATADWIVPVESRGLGPGSFVVQAHSNLCGGAPRVAHIRVVPGRAYVPIEQGGTDLGMCRSIDRSEPAPWRPRNR